MRQTDTETVRNREGGGEGETERVRERGGYMDREIERELEREREKHCIIKENPKDALTLY